MLSSRLAKESKCVTRWWTTCTSCVSSTSSVRRSTPLLKITIKIQIWRNTPAASRRSAQAKPVLETAPSAAFSCSKTLTTALRAFRWVWTTELEVNPSLATSVVGNTRTRVKTHWPRTPRTSHTPPQCRASATSVQLTSWKNQWVTSSEQPRNCYPSWLK